MAGGKGAQQLHALGQFLAVLNATGILQIDLNLLDLGFEIQFFHKVTHRFGAHFGDEFFAEFVLRFAKFDFAQELFLVQGRVARINNEIIFVIEHAFEIACRHIQHHAHPAGGTFKKPDVAHRHRQLNVPHAFAAHTGNRHFHTAAITDHALVLDAFVFAAGAFPVLGRAKDALAEQAAFFRLECAVIYRFRILDLAVAPRTDRLR